MENISIRCSICGKETGLSMYNMNTKYKYIITSFVFNTVLHHVGMSCIINTNKHLEYDTDKNNSYWIKVGPWYNTSIFKNLYGKVLKEFII